MRLVFTLIEPEHIIWAANSWTRKHMTSICSIKNWPYSLVPTTMGTEAFKFDPNLFYTVLHFFQTYEAKDEH